MRSLTSLALVVGVLGVGCSTVVFCTTTNGDPGGQNHYEFVNSFIAPLFWNLFGQF
jgi:hypothetical protein